jgi:hypothetical protein
MWTLDEAAALARRGVAIERAYLDALRRGDLGAAIGWASVSISPDEVYRAAWLATDAMVRPSRHAWPLD